MSRTKKALCCVLALLAVLPAVVLGVLALVLHPYLKYFGLGKPGDDN